MTTSSQQLLHLINEVLDTAKIEQGKMELQLAETDLIFQLKNTIDLFSVQAQSNQQSLVLQPPCLAHPCVLTDARRLDQILNNLVSNAVKYTPAGGTTRLAVEELAGEREGFGLYRFTVSDTGIGMSQEFLQRIFLPFEREDTTMTSQVVGVGLGMAITHNIVGLMGGRIDVQSTQGKGSTFTVVLPFQFVQSFPSADQPKTDTFTLQGLKLLLAEDNLLNMEIATELLQLDGAQVTGVENGQLAVERFAQSPVGSFDAVLLDIQMPVLDGYGAARAIRALDHPQAASIPIVAMTANAFADDVIAAREAGMDGHIAKPVDLVRIRQGLAAAFAQKPADSHPAQIQSKGV